MNMKWFARIVMVLLCLGLFTGCAKVSKENYDKIQTGMTYDQVKSILGSGTEASGGGIAVGDLAASGKVVTWGTEDKQIMVTFVNDKVTLKTMKGL